MPEKRVMKARNRRVPAGSLRHRVILEKRIHRPGGFGNADTDFEWIPATDQDGRRWADVQTRSGRTTFDGIDSERQVTHVVRMRKPAGISSEWWIRLKDGTRLDIIDIEDLDERGLFVEALCEATGEAAQKASG